MTDGDFRQLATSRRGLLRGAVRNGLAVSLAATLGSPAVAASLSRRPYVGPNVVLVRFGGGVRRRETIAAAHSFSPHLVERLLPDGVLFPKMEIAQLKQVETSHGQGTLNLLTGRYGAYRDVSTQPFSERFEPLVPTLFEYFRREFEVAEHETLIVNGEDRKDEEFYTFSNHGDFGIDYRCQTISLYRYKRFLLRQQLAEGGLTEAALIEKTRALAELVAIDHRQDKAPGQGPVIEAFWQHWRSRFGDSGLKNARGDALLTELALRAMSELRPRLMMVNYQDPDYVHWGNAAHYTQGIATIDRGLRQLVAAAQALPFYRDNTVFVVVPDCGRDDNPFQRIPFQHHFNSRSAHDVWALVFGANVPRGRVIDRVVDQTSVTATIGALMGFRTPHADAPVLVEALG